MTDSLVDSSPRQIGGHRVGPIAYGLWRFTTTDVTVATNLIETALEAGMNLIDTADVYGLDYGGAGFGSVEEQLGRVLKASPGLREQMVLATKGGILPPVPYDSGAKGLRTAAEDSLRRLGVDHIDLYQIHRPDLFTHPAEVAQTLSALHAEGKIGAIGVSNHTPAQTRALQAHLDLPLATTQPEYSAVQLGPLRDGTFDLSFETNLTVLAWSPLAGGRLATGRDLAPALLAVLDSLAERENVYRADIALAFLLAHPVRPIPIIGTQNPERIATTPTVYSVQLDRNDVYDIIEASEGVPLP